MPSTTNLPKMNRFEIIDISQPVSTKTACFPGDVPFSQKVTLSYEESKVVNLSAITMSPHVGTHTDAPAHIRGDYADPEQLVGSLPLDPFIGYVTVLDLSPLEKGAIEASHITQAMSPLVEQKKEMEEQMGRPVPFPFRYLLKTQKECKPDKFREEYPYLEVDAIQLLYARGANLIGIDTPSIDHVNSKTLDAHKTMVDMGIYWLENLDLSHVEPGGYFLVAAPIKLMETEAAPVRALLLHGF